MFIFNLLTDLKLMSSNKDNTDGCFGFIILFFIIGAAFIGYLDDFLHVNYFILLIISTLLVGVVILMFKSLD